MKPMTVLKNAWNDSVWSKVIASAITTGLGATLVAVARHWEPLKDLKDLIFRVAHAPVIMPAWLAAILGIFLAVVLAVLSLSARHRSDRHEQDIQPNAIPIVDATIVTRSEPRRGTRKGISCR
jgi:hypothetical protein